MAGSWGSVARMKAVRIRRSQPTTDVGTNIPEERRSSQNIALSVAVNEFNLVGELPCSVRRVD